MKFEEIIKDVWPGRYLLAVSGGVDSVVLFDLLVKSKKVDFDVVHFNHGIRKIEETKKDGQLVKELCHSNGINLKKVDLNLGPNASEQQARNQRRKHFFELKQKNNYSKIITAHHKDDVIETIIINLLRGTGRHGLSSLKNDENFARPLINIEKAEIKNYAEQHKLTWNEDSTNKDNSLLRNHVRNNLLPKIISRYPQFKDEFYKIYTEMLAINKEADDLLDALVSAQLINYSLKINDVIMLPIEVEFAFLHRILANQLDVEVDSKILDKLRNFLHTAGDNKKFDINKKWLMQINKQQANFVER